MDETQRVPEPRAPGTAVASLVLGILSVICLGPLTGIPAIVCGHLARSRIRRQAGAVPGGGLALAGLIMGYLSLVMVLVWVSIMGAGVVLLTRLCPPVPALPPQACSAHLKQIALALRMYSADHGDAFPPDFDTLVKNNYLGSRVMYLCPQRPGPVVPSGEGQPVDASTDYLYFGRGQSAATVDATTVLACDKPGNHPGTLNACFGDGHTATTSATDLDEALRRTGWKLPPPSPEAAVER